MASANIHDYIAPGRRAHLVGIGGVSMSPLAEVLHKAGMVITGSDMRNSATVEHLRALGIPVAIGHRGENVQGAELVIRTAAVHDENPEIAAARTLGYERVICAFQPHTYTRTHALFNDFVEALRAPDITLLAEIYAAREVNDIGISSKDLAARIPGSEYYATLPEVTERLRALARPGDLILTVGAGDIFTVGEALLREG